jgi:hypothetical protein
MRWLDLMKLPLALFTLGLETFTSTMRGFQRSLDQAMGAMTNPRAWAETSTAVPTDRPKGDDTVPNWSKSDQQDGDGGRSWYGSQGKCDAPPMGGQDLSGTDLKYVSYSILFTKRDHEATLQEQKEELIDYSTDGGSFASLKVSDFMGRLKTVGIDKPPTWKSRKYPTADTGTVKEIPDEDRKYITFVYRVKQRLPRQASEYDKEKVDVLRDIRDRIG